jgi:hypothetical protein
MANLKIIAGRQVNNLFNLKNELKKDQTNIKILKNSSFDSSFNSVQSLNIKQNNKNFNYNNIISKNILLRNMKYNFLKSILSSILKKKIRRISEILEDKPIKNYVLYSYLKFCIFTSHLNAPTHPTLDTFASLSPFPKGPLGKEAPFEKKGERDESSLPCQRQAGGAPAVNPKGGRTKLSLNKYKGRKLGSFINYNKIIGYKFNSTFYQAYPKSLAPKAQLVSPILSLPPLREAGREWETKGGLAKNRGNIYIKDTYKLLFYLFKSMYCLISKPVLNYTNDKVTIQLFYYLNIPKKKIFRLFSISYINSIKKKWSLRTQIEKKKTNFISPLGSALAVDPKGLPMPMASKAGGDLAQQDPNLLDPNLKARGGVGRTHMPRGNTKIYIRWKLRKAISRFKNKYISCPPSPLGSTLAVDPKGLPMPMASSDNMRQGGGGGKNLLFKLRKFNITKVYQNKFKLICAILSNKFNKPVELQLIRLHQPYHDSNILVNLLSLNIKNKRKKARVAIQKIYNKKPVKNLNDPNLNKPALPTAESHDSRVKAIGTGYLTPAFLSGLNIKIAGRLMGEPIIPRITTKVFSNGASATGKVNYLDVARITKKNRKGAYTIKITSGQNFF